MRVMQVMQVSLAHLWVDFPVTLSFFSLLYFINYDTISELVMTGGTCVADDGRKWANNVFAELVLPSVETFFKIDSPLTP